MSEQEVEEQISSDENLDDETGEDNGTPDKNPDNKKTNKSNWKSMSEAKQKLERDLAEAQEELNAWRSENPDIVKSTLSKKSDGIDKWDLALFLVQNPEAKGHLDEVKEYMADMKNPDIEKAWKYVKPTIVTESKSSMDFSIKSSKSTKIDLNSISIEDTKELSKEQRSEWRKLHWYA